MALAEALVPERTALLVIDVQNDFALSGAKTALPQIEAAVDRCKTLIDLARAAGVTPWFVRVVTTPATDSRALRRFMQRIEMPDGAGICRKGTHGAAYYRVRPDPGEPEIEKRLYCAFTGTSLAEDLRARGVEAVVLCGLTTECCVDATARTAFHRDFDVFIARDACAAHDMAMHDATLGILALQCASIVTVADLAAIWR